MQNSMSVLLRYQQLIRKVCKKEADAQTAKQLNPIRGTCFFFVKGKWEPYKLRLGRGKHHQPPSKHASPRYEETMQKNANRDEWVMSQHHPAAHHASSVKTTLGGFDFMVHFQWAQGF